MAIMFGLIHICSQYELLKLLAQHLSSMDLYHTTLTCSALYDIVLGSAKGFEQLGKVTLCDGSGLRARREYVFQRQGEHEREAMRNIRCDETGGLPCLKCGVSVCESCCIHPRYGIEWSGPLRKLHYPKMYEQGNIVCYCNDCDQAVEGRLGEGNCGCDGCTRWICRSCHAREDNEEDWYRKHCTKLVYWIDDWNWTGMTLPDGLAPPDVRAYRQVSSMHVTPANMLEGLSSDRCCSTGVHVELEPLRTAISDVCGARGNRRL